VEISYMLSVAGFRLRIIVRSLQEKAFHFSQMWQHMTPLHKYSTGI